MQRTQRLHRTRYMELLKRKTIIMTEYNDTDNLKIHSCLICGGKLMYFTEKREMTCYICGKKFKSNACCKSGHFVCDECHEEKALENIVSLCLSETCSNPIDIICMLMNRPEVYMHGPEHHVLVGAALLSAYFNATSSPLTTCFAEENTKEDSNDMTLESSLREMLSRGKSVPGGTCGFWGMCGAALSAGIFMSIITKTTPLSEESWGHCMMLTSRILCEIGKIGGPRCCKRGAFISIRETAVFIKENLGIDMEMPDKIICSFYENNNECLAVNCPFFPNNRNHKPKGK